MTGRAGGETVVVCGSLAHPELIDAASQHLRMHTLARVHVPERDDSRTPEEHAALWRRLIDRADRVVAVTKPDGTIGEAVASEVAYARSIGRPVGWHPGSLCPDGAALQERLVRAIADSGWVPHPRNQCGAASAVMDALTEDGAFTAVPAPGTSRPNREIYPVMRGYHARQLPIGSVIRWLPDRSEQGLRMHTPIGGWVPVVSDTADYEVLFTLGPPSSSEVDVRPNLNRVSVMAEVADGQRCGVCEQRFDAGDFGTPIGVMSERVHDGCPEEGGGDEH